MDIAREQLEKLIFEDKLSYLEIGRMFGVSNTTVVKKAKKLGIVLESRRKINPNETFNKDKTRKVFNKCEYCSKNIMGNSNTSIYCSRNCFNEHTKQKTYTYFLSSPIELQRADYDIPDSIKHTIIKEQSCKCDICGIDEIWNYKKLVFILDHIDGDASNNTRDNLRGVCPNCDSQLDTYKSKNKNSAREKRYKNK